MKETTKNNENFVIPNYQDYIQMIDDNNKSFVDITIFLYRA